MFCMFIHPSFARHVYTVAGQFKLSGADHPGIVHKLTSTLANNGLTIGSMKTSHEEAPFGGTELFTSKHSPVDSFVLHKLFTC